MKKKKEHYGQRGNKDLKRLEKWREFQTSKLNFLINSIGGHIPIIGNVLTGIYSLGYIAEKRIYGKNGWTMING